MDRKIMICLSSILKMIDEEDRIMTSAKLVGLQIPEEGNFTIDEVEPC
ncbi:MAG: hypothetical protein ACLSG9_08440 [Eubacterium sp.]